MDVNPILDEIGAARIIYDNYPSSDLLPMCPNVDLQSMQGFYDYCLTGDLGDTHFQWIVSEICEVTEGLETKEEVFAEIERVLYVGVTDIESVNAGFTQKKMMSRR